MEVNKERKYVKDKAAIISAMLKKLDRARIDESKDYKVRVEAEAKSIRERLEAANLPFTALIDKHKEERAAILAKEKAIEESKALAAQILIDHDSAIMEEKVRKFEKAEAEKLAKELVETDRLQAAEAARIKAEEDAQEAIDKAEREKQAAIEREQRASLQAEENERLRIAAVESERVAKIHAEEMRVEAEKQSKINTEKAAETARIVEVMRQEDEKEAERVAQEIRDSDKRHIGNVRRAAKEALMMYADLTENEAKLVVLAISKKLIASITINY